MQYQYILDALQNNLDTFQSLLSKLNSEEVLFKKESYDWCILEIVCHLLDEEREDFRMRLQTVLESPHKHPPTIDPEGWVKDRKYIDQDFEEKKHAFFEERKASLDYLSNLDKPDWGNYYEHPILGRLDGHHFIKNWLAHDYLHIRQITQRKYQYLQDWGNQKCSYAGNW